MTTYRVRYFQPQPDDEHGSDLALMHADKDDPMGWRGRKYDLVFDQVRPHQPRLEEIWEEHNVPGRPRAGIRSMCCGDVIGLCHIDKVGFQSPERFYMVDVMRFRKVTSFELLKKKTPPITGSVEIEPFDADPVFLPWELDEHLG